MASWWQRVSFILCIAQTSFQTSYLSSIHFQSVFFWLPTQCKTICAVRGCCLSKTLKINSLSLWHHKDPLAEKLSESLKPSQTWDFGSQWLHAKSEMPTQFRSWTQIRFFFIKNHFFSWSKSLWLIVCPLATNGSPLWNLLCYKAGKS